MKILMTFVLGLSVFAPFAFAEENREHGAHQHGAASLAIAFEGAKGKIEFKGAADGILGFEHEAKSAKDIKALSEANTKFEKEISKMIQMDSSLGCQFAKETVGMVKDHKEEKHADFVANFYVTCGKSPEGTALVVDFSGFSRIKDLDITVLAGTVQKSAEYKKKPVKIEMK